MPPARREAHGLRRWPRDGQGTRWCPSGSGGYTTLETTVCPRPCTALTFGAEPTGCVCTGRASGEREEERDTDFKKRAHAMADAWRVQNWQGGPAGRNLGREWPFRPRGCLLAGGQTVLGLRLIERGPPTPERNLLYSKFTNLSLRLLKKHPYRNSQNNV